ncbi:hypothetical protein B0H13DRAFT_2351597 [Mycena leptocephala]|nr:hypothetical protein B0H13DRAFT_2351597 [Mycena leptocephala]
MPSHKGRKYRHPKALQPEIKLIQIKCRLVSEKEAVIKDKKLVTLPRVPTVQDLLAEFEVHLTETKPSNAIHIDDISEDVQDAFNAPAKPKTTATKVKAKGKAKASDNGPNSGDKGSLKRALKRELPPLSHLGFLIPNHSSKPSESNYLKQTRPKNKGSGDPDPDGNSSDSDSDGGKKGKKGHPKVPGKREKSPGRTGHDPDDDPSSSDDEDGKGRGHSNGRKPPPKSRKGNDQDSKEDNGRYFDLRLKDSDVPKWNNPDSLLRWIQRCNLIAEDGPKAWQQLGKIVPRVLTGTAQDWYFSLPLDYQRDIREHWETMRQALADFFLSSKWLDKTRTKALRAVYRQIGHGKEKPTEYFIRKRELLNSVYSFEDSAVMSEVMNGAPQFHSAIVFHEDTLLDLPMNRTEDHGKQDQDRRKTFEISDATARTNLIGASPTLPPPKFPRDDSNGKQIRQIKPRGLKPDDIRAQEEYDEFLTGPSTFQVGTDLKSGGDNSPTLKGNGKKASFEEVEDEEDIPFSKLHPASPFTIIENNDDFILPIHIHDSTTTSDTPNSTHIHDSTTTSVPKSRQFTKFPIS